MLGVATYVPLISSVSTWTDDDSKTNMCVNVQVIAPKHKRTGTQSYPLATIWRSVSNEKGVKRTLCISVSD